MKYKRYQIQDNGKTVSILFTVNTNYSTFQLCIASLAETIVSEDFQIFYVLIITFVLYLYKLCQRISHN